MRWSDLPFVSVLKMINISFIASIEWCQSYNFFALSFHCDCFVWWISKYVLENVSKMIPTSFIWIPLSKHTFEPLYSHFIHFWIGEILKQLGSRELCSSVDWTQHKSVYFQTNLAAVGERIVSVVWNGERRWMATVDRAQCSGGSTLHTHHSRAHNSQVQHHTQWKPWLKY